MMTEIDDLLNKKIEDAIAGFVDNSKEPIGDDFELVAVAALIKQAHQPVAADGFKFELRRRIEIRAEEMFTEISQARGARKATPRPLSSLRLKVTSVLLALSLLGGSTAYAASFAMPGDILYPAKLASERVVESVTFSRSAKAELNLTYYERRISELKYSLTRGDSNKLDDCLESLTLRETAAERHFINNISADQTLRLRFIEMKTEREMLTGKQESKSLKPIIEQKTDIGSNEAEDEESANQSDQNGQGDDGKSTSWGDEAGGNRSLGKGTILENQVADWSGRKDASASGIGFKNKNPLVETALTRGRLGS